MLSRFAADENFDARILRGLVLRRPSLDLVTVQDAEVHAMAPIGRVFDDLLLLIEASDPEEWDGQVHYLPL